MWFVWDGQRRHGPLNENEICRRITAGEYSLQSWIRGEDDSFYRPVIWMLRVWTSSQPSQFSTKDSILLDATQIAAPLGSLSTARPSTKLSESISHETDNSSEVLTPSDVSKVSGYEQNETTSRRAEFSEDLNESSRSRQLEFSLKDSLKSFLGAKLSDLKLFSRSGNEKLIQAKSSRHEDYESNEASELDRAGSLYQHDSQRNSDENARDLIESESDGEGVRHSPSSNRFETVAHDGDTTTNVDSNELAVALPRNLVAKNQMPKVASEGVVSLASKKQQTRAKVRRVNPTAPRQPKRKKNLWTILSRSISQTFSDPFQLKVFAISFLLTLSGLMAYMFYKKQSSSDYRFTVVSEPSIKPLEVAPNPTIEQIRSAVAASNSKTESLKKGKKQRNKVQPK
ncbi:MAG: hypothetical protein RJB13_1299, partial [Pseudomonadota bacterium]